MTHAARIGSLLVLAIAAAPGAAIANGHVGTVFVTGYEHHGYSRYSHGYNRYSHPYGRWNSGRHSIRYPAIYAPRYAYHGWPRVYVYYSSPRYYGHQRGFPHRHGRFCSH